MIKELFEGPYAWLAKWGVIALLVSSFGGYCWLKGNTHGTEKLIEFQAKLSINNAKIDAINRTKQEKADEENRNTRAALINTINGMRLAKPPATFVPGVPAGSRRPDLICFDRAEYIRADGEFVTEARGLADEGSKSTVDLNTAKKWAK